jgi:2-polyprenyl-3-methyl-5-hydroxy-6-metoxy-1,4-benzoquinol methylase
MSYFSNSRPEIQKIVPIDKVNILDVGCGEGNFGYALKQKNPICKVTGIEPDEKSAKIAETKIDTVYNTFFDSSISDLLESKKFDLICFNDVLEHLAVPEKALEICKKHLDREGLIIASVPNILHYQEFINIIKYRDFKYEEAGIMDKTHLRFFTKKSFIRLFEESGYKVLEVIGLDPTKSKLMDLISFVTFGRYAEMRYPQFLIIAKCK